MNDFCHNSNATPRAQFRRKISSPKRDFLDDVTFFFAFDFIEICKDNSIKTLAINSIINQLNLTFRRLINQQISINIFFAKLYISRRAFIFVEIYYRNLIFIPHESASGGLHFHAS